MYLTHLKEKCRIKQIRNRTNLNGKVYFMNLRSLISLTAIMLLVSWPVTSPARFFTDPSIPLTQIEIDKDEPVEEIKEEKKEQIQEEKKEEQKKEQKEEKKKQDTPAQKRKTAQLGVKIGYNFKPTIKEDDLGKVYTDSKDRFSFDMAAELVFNPFKHLGLGIGADLMADAFDDVNGDRHFLGAVPIYGIFKLYLLDGTTPYVAFNIGYNAATLYNVDTKDTGNDYDISKEKGGLHYSIAGGILVGMGLQIELAYSVTRGGFTQSFNSGLPVDVSFEHSRITLSLAYFF